MQFIFIIKVLFLINAGFATLLFATYLLKLAANEIDEARDFLNYLYCFISKRRFNAEIHEQAYYKLCEDLKRIYIPQMDMSQGEKTRLHNVIVSFENDIAKGCK